MTPESPRDRFRRSIARLLTATAALGVLSTAFVPVLQAQVPAVQSARTDRKVAAARASGYWVIEEGEHLYRISRHFAADDAEVRRLATELQSLNEHALMYGDPSRLVIGARLRLPDRLVTGRAEAKSADVRSPAVAPASAPQAQPPDASREGATPGAPPVRAPDPGAATTAKPAPPATYVDKLIEGAAAEGDVLAEAAARDTSPGLRSWAVEYRLDHRDTNTIGSSLSQGLRLQHRRETERFGDFALDAEAGREDAVTTPGRGATSVGKATFYHENFALTDRAVANSALGVTRLTLSPWLANSYRVSLPSSMIAGATTSVAMPDAQWRAGVGSLGRIAGVSIQDFEYTSGQAASLEYARRMGGDWIVGGGLVSVRGNDVVPDSTSLTLATEFALPGAASKVKLQGLADDQGGKGFWLDGQHRAGRLAQRFGGYQLDPDLAFADAAPQRDMRGLYWRGDYRGGTDFTTANVEATQTNLDRDPARGGNTSVGASVSTTLRLDRTMSVGGGLSLRNERPRTSSGEGRDVGLVNAFFSRSNALGQSRLDASLNLTRPEVSGAERIRTLSWSQDWPRLASVEGNSLVTLTDEYLADRHVRRTSVSLGLRGPLYGTLRWDATVTGVDVRDGPDSERNYNSSVNLDWNPAASWLVRLQWQRNQIQPTAANPLSPFVRENVVQLIARYEQSQGSPYPQVGAAAGRSGTGRITGQVFFDENGDGARQATERAASGIVVVLDGRRAETTDPEGRFTFSLVPAGDHQVSIVVERVPLPWGLEDEAPRPVKVGVREDSRVDFGLKRISP